MQQRRRRDTRLTTPSPMQLTDRDKEIVRAIYDYRVLRQDHVQTLFFGSNPGAKARTQKRLVKLFDHKYLTRFFLPTRGGLNSSPILYGLDKRGAELLRLEFGYDELHWYGSMKELKNDFLEHTLAIADFRVAVTVACQNAGYKLLVWRGENELKADYDRVNIRTSKGQSHSVSIIPDSYFSIDTPKGKAHFFLEVDRGTMTNSRFQGKVEAYVAYFQQGYQRRYRTKSLRILTVTLSHQRLINLKQTTERIADTTWFWFATLPQLTPDTVLSAPIWSVAGNNTVIALIEQAE